MTIPANQTGYYPGSWLGDTGSSAYGNPQTSQSGQNYASPLGPSSGSANPYGVFAPTTPTQGAATLAAGSVNGALSGNSLQNANTGWQNAYTQEQNINNQAYTNAAPAYQTSLNNENSINYQPYLNASNQAGSDLMGLSNTSGQQMGQYGQQAQAAYGEQNSLYGAGQQLENQAFNTNNAQFLQTQQQLSDQVNAGQAQRGLGNSAVGGSEYNNAMQNFDIGWNTQQLQNEQIGVQGMSTAANAGANQGQLGNQMLQNQTTAGQNQAQFLQQGAAMPTQAQQYAYAQPAQNAAQYATNMGGLSSAYTTQMSQAIPYINNGNGALMANSQFGANQTASELGMVGSVLGNSGVQSALGSAGSWLGNMTGASGASGAASNVAPAGMSSADASAAGYNGADAAYSSAAAASGYTDAAGEVAASSGGDVAEAAAATAWIVCTELHKQGRMPSKWYITGFRKFSEYSEEGKRGYYIWAIPSVKHLRKHPYSLFSKLLEWVFLNRAEYIAAQCGVRGAKKTLSGFLILTSTYALCWTLSRTIARKPIDWTVLYKNEAKS